MPDDKCQTDARRAVVESHLQSDLSDAELQQVERRIAESVEMARRLRRVPLENSDAPDGIFVPYRAPRE